MITKAYIHEYGNGRLEPEQSDVKSVLESRGIECELFTSKRLARNQLDLNEKTLVVGDHPTIATVFKRIKYSNFGDSYPKSLRGYLKRDIWESNLGKILVESQNRNFLKLFIKPRNTTKLFTGHVLHSEQDLHKLTTISKNTELYCSTVVDWLAEYRVFINDSKIVGVKNYDGDPNLSINMNEVEKAIIDFENSNDKTAAYSLDFGIIGNGETAFIEWNDGFALGSYGLDKNIYTDLIVSRWIEVLKKALEF